MTVETQHSRLAEDPAMPRRGDVLDGRYRIESVLGEGGFAAVFKATDAKTGKAFAVKVLDPLMSRREEFRKRFFLEVSNSSKLNHINTIHVSDQGETDTGCLYLVMELLEGKSLDELLEDRGPMPPKLVHSVAVQTLRSLREAHQLNILHRDIKPANIFLVSNATDGEDVFVKVVDFGIAKSMDTENDAALTSTGQVMCSPHYVAPERVVNHDTYPSSDIYSLGISMIEMLEGTPPYHGDNTIQLVMMHARMDTAVPMKESTRNSVLGPIIERATHKDHTKRYQSADEMLAALREINFSQPIRIPSAPEEPAPSGGLLQYWPIPVVFVVTVVIGLLLWSFMRNPDQDLQDDTAAAQIDDANDAPPDTPSDTMDSDAMVDPDDDHAALGEMGHTQHTLRSDPEGARIYIDDRYIDRTPWTFVSDALPDTPFELRLTLNDGREHTERIERATDLDDNVFRFASAAPTARDDGPRRKPTSSDASREDRTPPKDTNSGAEATQAQQEAQDRPSSSRGSSSDSTAEKPASSGAGTSKPSSSSPKEDAPAPKPGEDLLEQLRKKNSGGGYGSAPSGGSGGYYD